MSLFCSIFTDQSLSKTAVLCDGDQLTYEQLRDQAIGMAHALNLLGIATGDRVALLLNDSPEFIGAFIATCSSGAIAVPINMSLPFDEQLTILDDCTASVVFGEANLCRHLLASNRLRYLRNIVVVRNETLEWSGSSEIRIHLLDQLIKRAKGHHSAPPFMDGDENQPAFILYTSGSTGEPKGAVHRQCDIFYTNATFCREVLRLRDGDRLFSSSRLPFAYGLGNSLTFPLLNGHTTILCREKPTPKVIGRVFDEYKPTIFFAVPVVYNLLLDQQRRHKPLNCSSLRLCVSAGEALPAQLGEEWENTFGVPVLDGIGSTEMLHMWMSNREGEVRYGSSGKLLQGYEAKLLDQDGRETPSGHEGNLWIKGASAALGYWAKPDATARTFVDGWIRTGDLYRCDSAGYWYHLGRSDDCFKSSGQWVSPVEVEAALLRHDGVNQAAVVADVDEVGLPCASAFVIFKDLKSDPFRVEAELRELVRTVLPRFKQPRRYLFVKELPYTATGKVQRFKLREQIRGMQDEG